MPVQAIIQRDYSKGLVVVTQTFSSPPGSVTQISNLQYSRRGGLAAIGGSVLTGTPAAGYAANAGAFMDFFWFQPGVTTGYEVALQDKGAGNATVLIKPGFIGYDATKILATFPISNISGALILTGPTGTPNGGMAGQVSALSRIIEFGNQLILLLGNGITPYAYPDGGPAVALANNFVSSFPIWITATPYQLGTFVVPSPGNGHLYRCIQAGTSGGAQPAFPTTQGTIIADGTVIWQESGSNAVVAPRGAAHGVTHAGFLWLFNTSPTTNADLLSGPSCLSMSDLNNGNSWNPLNLAHLDKDDGTEGMGLASFAISEAGIAPSLILIAFKNYKTFVINSVFGAPDFYITRARTDMGCVAPKSIQFINGLGVVRLTHKGVALFDGIRDRVVSDAIRPYLFNELGGTDYPNVTLLPYANSAQYTNPPMYMIAIPLHNSFGPMTRILCWDILLGAWTIIDLPISILGLSQEYRSSYIDTQPTVFGSFTGIMQQFQPQMQVASVWGSPAGSVAWSFTTPEVFAKAPGSRTYFRRLLIRGSYFGTAPLTMNVIITVNGAGGPVQTTKNFQFSSSNQFECEVPIMLTGLSANAQISGTDSVEIGSVEWHLVPKESGPPASFMQ